MDKGGGGREKATRLMVGGWEGKKQIKKIVPESQRGHSMDSERTLIKTKSISSWSMLHTKLKLAYADQLGGSKEELH